MPKLEPIYDAIHRVIKNLGKEEAIEVLGEVSSHCDAMAEALEQELSDEEDE